MPDGKFVLMDAIDGSHVAVLNESSLTWIEVQTMGSPYPDESGWTLLPNGKVLSVNSWTPRSAYTFDPSTLTWTKTPSTIVDLTQGAEQGPVVLRPDGTAVAFGARGNNSIYNSLTGNWTLGQTIITPTGYPCAISDGPGNRPIISYIYL